MNLYVIKGVLQDYSSGCAIIKAESILQARDFLNSFLKEYGMDEQDVDEEIHYFNQSMKTNNYIEMVLDKKDSKAPGIIHLQWGGG